MIWGSLYDIPSVIYKSAAYRCKYPSLFEVSRRYVSCVAQNAATIHLFLLLDTQLFFVRFWRKIIAWFVSISLGSVSLDYPLWDNVDIVSCSRKQLVVQVGFELVPDEQS